MTKLTRLAVAGAVLLTAAAAVGRDDSADVLARVRTELKKSDTVTFDSRNRLNVRWTAKAVQAGSLATRSADLMASFGRILWSGRNFKILETKVESSRFGSVAHSTITLDGFPVIDQYLRVRSAADGSLRSAELSIPADCRGLTVSADKPSVALEDAATVIRAEALRFNGLVVPDQVQRVWFMDADGILAPGGRMLLKGADMTRLFEAVVDLRTGRLVRFVDIARR